MAAYPERFTLSELPTVAKALLPLMQPGSTIGLQGDLAAGKTTLVRAIVAALGGKAEQVASPTYALCHEYQLPNDLLLEHWDLYRLGNKAPLPEELYRETSKNTLRLVEWPSADLIVQAVIRLEVVGESERGLVVSMA